MPILTCGPFAQVQSKNAVLIKVPLQTQGDFVGTEEGHEALTGAVNSLMIATSDGKLPQNCRTIYYSNDRAQFEIPYDSWTEATEAQAAIKKLIPQVTGSVVTDRMIIRG